MSDAIKNFATQFTYQPVVKNAKKLKTYDRYFLIGMGGSHLPADLALLWNPNLPLEVHNDYGLPRGLASSKKPLVIACSYSGNTEETIDGLKLAIKQKIPVAIIAVGGVLIDYAQKHQLPYIQVPNTRIQPRCALGFTFRALLKLLGDEKGLRESAKLSRTLNPMAFEKQGKQLAKKLDGRVPVIYSSHKNFTLAWNWKIKLNETGKIPAFFNMLPELNHNEMNGFDIQPPTRALSERFTFILLQDKKDHPRVQKRMKILEKLYRDRGLAIEILPLEGKTLFEKVFSCLLLADWTSLFLAEHYGLESEQVPMVEEFKAMMKA